MSERRLIPYLVLASVVVLMAALTIGPWPMPVGDSFNAFFGGGAANDRVVIWEIRLPRAIAAFCVGAALGVSGAALQGLLRNPLAEPGVLGVSATSSLAAVCMLYFGIARDFPVLMPLAAIGGAVLATLFIGAVAIGTSSSVSLILVGAALSSFAGALMSLLMSTAQDLYSLSDMVDWMMGSVSNRSFDDILLSGPFIAAGAILLLTQGRSLAVLSLGEEAAHGAGLDLKRTRLLVTLGAGLAVGGAVSLAGIIGFVGIVAPHIVRPWVRHDPGRTLIPSALLAGLMLTISDIVIRILPTSTELKLGVVAAIVGAPIFAWIAARRRPSDG